jgi:hypothetical protein
MPISVTISPATPGPIKQERIQRAHTLRNTQQFKATVDGDPANAGVTWMIAQGGGQITSEGLFTPPIDWALGKSTVQATSVTDKTKWATAVVTYTDKAD